MHVQYISDLWVMLQCEVFAPFSYGGHLAEVQGLNENRFVGQAVNNATGVAGSYWIGKTYSNRTLSLPSSCTSQLNL